MKKRYADLGTLGTLTEAQRIKAIGDHAMTGQSVGFIVDAEDKGDRYVAELNRLYPRLDVRLIGPVTEHATAYKALLKPPCD